MPPKLACPANLQVSRIVTTTTGKKRKGEIPENARKVTNMKISDECNNTISKDWLIEWSEMGVPLRAL